MFGGNRPPKGWTIAHGRLEEEATVWGYLERRCEVIGSCHRRDCRRRVHLDLAQMIKDGQALLRMWELKDTYRCGRIERCTMTWSEKPSRPVTLDMVAGFPNIAVEVRCIGPCNRPPHVTTVTAMIGRLQKAGTGGPKTDVRKIADAIPSPCGTCKAKHWRVEILWHDGESPKLPLWRQDLDRRLQDAEFRRAAQPMAPGPPADTPRRRASGGRG